MRLTRAAMVLLASLAGSASAGSDHAHRTPPPLACPEAGIAHVVLPDGLDGIDGVRVYVSDAAPGAATDVTVLAGHHDRTVRAISPGVMDLQMSEPIRAHHFEVALEPVLDAPEGACVSRVELLRSGAVVGSAEIR